jgi:phytoene dehydrogenase-like protein
VSEPTILIIGAGMAGLAAGCYAQMNGYHSHIFDLHFLPGGLCTSWRRGDYLFDGAVRYLTGTSPRASTHALWDELGLLQDKKIYYYSEFSRYEGQDGRSFRLHTNIDELEEHMLALSPNDENPIRDLTGAIRQFRDMALPVDITPSGLLEWTELGKQMLPVLAPALRWMTVPLRQFAQRFRDPLLREGLPAFFQLTPPDFPAMLALATLAEMNDRESGYPIGGSLSLAETLAARYEALGGEIHYKSRVSRILVDDDAHDREAGRAVGLQLADGARYDADIVISACDGRSTIFDLLDARYVNNTVRSYYRDLRRSASLMQVSLGVAEDFSGEPPMLNFPLRERLELGGISHDRLVLKHYAFDPTMAPPGKTVLSLWIEADYDYWQRLHADPNQYDTAKARVAEKITDVLNARYPGLRSKVEVVDVATPITYERYTGNWRGAFAGWAMTTRKMTMMTGRGMSKKLPNLEHFYMIGQWVEPGGNVQLSAASGRDVIRDICRESDRPFRVQSPGR